MAQKIKVNYAKCKVVNGVNTFIVKVRVQVDITPDSWYFESMNPNMYIKEGSNPNPETDYSTEYTILKREFSSDGKWLFCTYSITATDEGTSFVVGLTYHIIAAMPGEAGPSGGWYKSKPLKEVFRLQNGGNPILLIETYSGWKDISSYIPVPEYNVNNVPILEEWTDANYNLHSSSVQTQIKGNFSLRFPDRSALNTFLAALKYNEKTYGNGRVRLKVQVNNEIDLDDAGNNPSQETIDAAFPATYIDIFKITWEPDWALPFYGSSQSYNAISVAIEEIED